MQNHAVQGAAQSEAARRAALLLFLPLGIGACAPWATWLATGRVACWTLIASMFAMATCYLAGMWYLGDREEALRRNLGRRYEPPTPMLALAVCMGLCASFLVPGLSAGALAEAIGLPRLMGAVGAYVPDELAQLGAHIQLSPTAMPPGSRMEFLPDGQARVTVPRFGQPVTFAVPWTAEGQKLCLEGWCLVVDAVSGRVRVSGPGGLEVGRVAAIGAPALPPADRSGAPWEIGNLFAPSVP
jgi:hypothetical protein